MTPVLPSLAQASDGPACETMFDMGQTAALEQNPRWRVAIWSLRVGYAGLVVVCAGLIALAAGSTPWVLAAGMFIWLPAAIITAAGFLWARHELPEPRPGFWSIRLALLHDSVHARSPAQRS
jgi:hypothetical protein